MPETAETLPSPTIKSLLADIASELKRSNDISSGNLLLKHNHEVSRIFDALMPYVSKDNLLDALQELCPEQVYFTPEYKARHDDGFAAITRALPNKQYGTKEL